MLTEIKTKTEHYFVDENNLKQGEYKTYHDNGQLYIHTFYINSIPHGEFKSYYHTGNLWAHTFYQNGKHHGESKVYYDNDQLRYVTFFYQGNDLKVDPATLTEKDKVYIMMSGRLPPRV